MAKSISSFGYLMVIFSGLLFLSAAVISLTGNEKVRLSSPISIHSVSLDSCQDITQPGFYELVSDIKSESSVCFTIASDNVTLDGKGFKIVAKTPGTGIIIEDENVQVTNLKLFNFSTGVSIEDVSGALVTLSSFEGNGFGIYSKTNLNNLPTLSQNTFNHNIYGIVFIEPLSATNANSFSSSNSFTGTQYVLLSNASKFTPVIKLRISSVSDRSASISYDLVRESTSSIFDCSLSINDEVSRELDLNENIVSINSEFIIRSLKENTDYTVKSTCTGEDTEVESNSIRFKTLASEEDEEYFFFSVTLSGDGDGKVISKPSGIDCGSDCTGTFLRGSVVNLTAYPSNGSIFVGFTRSCQGNQSCILIMNSSKNVDANFAYLGVAPYPASSLEANLYSQGKIRLVWSDNSDDESGFKIYRSDFSNSSYNLINTTLANITHYFDNLPIEKGTFYYIVRSFKESFESISSNSALVNVTYDVPSPPYALEIKPTSAHNIKLTWKSFDNRSDFTVLRSDNIKLNSFFPITELNSSTLVFEDENLTASKIYYYKIYSSNEYAHSSYSPVVYAKTNNCGFFARLLVLEC